MYNPKRIKTNKNVEDVNQNSNLDNVNSHRLPLASINHKPNRHAKQQALRKISNNSLHSNFKVDKQNRYDLRQRKVSYQSISSVEDASSNDDHDRLSDTHDNHSSDNDVAINQSDDDVKEIKRNIKRVTMSSSESSNSGNDNDNEYEPDEQQSSISNIEEFSNINLLNESTKSLRKYLKKDLESLCKFNNINLNNLETKNDLIKLLIKFKNSLKKGNSNSSNSSNSVSLPSTTTTASITATVTPASNSTIVNKKASSTSSNDRKRKTNLNSLIVNDNDSNATSKPNKSNSNDDNGIELDLQQLGLDNKEINSSLIEKRDKIGSGGFKDVYIGLIRRKYCAIADIRGDLSESDIKELQVLSKLNHPNIVKFIGVSIPEDKSVPCMLISELCRNGDLFDYIRNVKPPTNKKVFQILLEISKGLDYLHSCKPSVIHRDVKSSNVLIDDKGHAKLNDFGLARVKQSTRSMIRSLVGTVNWQAPELWHPKPSYTSSVDIFSAALVFWEVLQWHLPKKKYPWEGQNEHFIYDQVGNKKLRPSLNGFKKQWGSDIIDLIERMWSHDSKQRPSAHQVVEQLQTIISNTKN